jgi:hypothetical protein
MYRAEFDIDMNSVYRHIAYAFGSSQWLVIILVLENQNSVNCKTFRRKEMYE